MSGGDFYQLTTKDYSTIEVMLERYEGRDETMTAILRQKIAKAVVMFPGDIPSDVVTLGSRVTFRVNDDPAQTRNVADDGAAEADAVLSIGTPRGVALLGLAEGERVTIFNEDGSIETLAVLEVAHQPEAAARSGERPARADTRGGVTRPPFLRVVHSSDDAPQKATPAGKPTFSSSFEDPDHDPDPTAA